MQQFTIIYKNDPAVRTEIEKLILASIKMNFNFQEHPVKSHIFQTLAEWPNRETLASLPFSVQVEEVRYDGGEALISIRKLITDVEEVKPAEPAP
jgi:hypothetical protein